MLPQKNADKMTRAICVAQQNQQQQQQQRHSM